MQKFCKEVAAIVKGGESSLDVLCLVSGGCWCRSGDLSDAASATCSVDTMCTCSWKCTPRHAAQYATCVA